MAENSGYQSMYLSSLGDWLDAVRKSGVPYCEGEKISEPTVEDLMSAMDMNPTEGAIQTQRDIYNSEEVGYMWRWDVCAPEKWKNARGLNKDLSHEDIWRVSVDDPRLIDILHTAWPSKTLPVWKRPIIAAMKTEDGYPIELRVFVEDFRVVGISNYYPQTSLYPPTDFVKRVVMDAYIYANNIIEALPDLFEWDGEVSDTFSGTIDFVIDKGGRCVFLEGGPPYGRGADPCCFPEGKPYGIALSTE